MSKYRQNFFAQFKHLKLKPLLYKIYKKVYYLQLFSSKKNHEGLLGFRIGTLV